MVSTPITTKEHVHQKMTDPSVTTTSGTDREISRAMVHTVRWPQGIETTMITVKTSVAEIAIALTTGKNQVPANPSGQEHRESTITQGYPKRTMSYALCLC
jgi:hypothetical protein